MSDEQSSETVKKQASDLKPVDNSKTETENKAEKQKFSVPLEGTVYAVEADNASQAAKEAKKLHNKEKKS